MIKTNIPKNANIRSNDDALELPLAKAEGAIYKLQKRLFKAKVEGRKRDVKFLSSLISKSYYAFILAFERVVRKNTGKKTAGVDKVKLKYIKKDFEYTYNKFYLPFILKGIKRYKPKPLRRIDIPKPDGTKRHLGIPTHWDRIYQAMLTYIIETLVEVDTYTHKLNSFGFRRKIKTADAIGNLAPLAHVGKNAIVIEADIQKCFDEISHGFIIKTLKDENLSKETIKNIQKMLKSGFVDLTGFHETDSGTPQGGIISPALANLVLRKQLDIPFQDYHLIGITDKNLVTYADDLIISITPNPNTTSTTLIQTISNMMDDIRKNLAEVGLVIKDSKTLIMWNGWNKPELPPRPELISSKDQEDKKKWKAHATKDNAWLKKVAEIKGLNWDIGIQESKDITFDFLGFQLGIGTGIRPAKKKLKKFLEKINELIKKGSAVKASINPVIRGFYNYYATFSSKLMCEDLGKCDWYINRQIWKRTGKDGKYTTVDLKSLTTYADIRKTTKYITVVKGASYLSEPKKYWEDRESKVISSRKKFLWKQQKKTCPICRASITLQDIIEDKTETHHVLEKGKGGKDTNKNVVLIHEPCHKKVHKHL